MRSAKLFAARRIAPAVTLALFGACLAAAEPTGETIYRQKCAACHGDHGQGSKDHPQPLVGERPIGGLTKFIDAEMPQDDPDACSPEESALVAAYIFDAFYSPAAQVRNSPPRVELARLTVRQYQNSLADLIGSFAERQTWGDERGLRGEYFKGGRRFRDDRRQIDRTDATINFDFGEGTPDEKLDEKEFSIRWTGGVLAPKTGDYEFVLQTKNGARLWVNSRDDNAPLIDAWVRSGEHSEYRETIRLLGGRVYPLKLECFKSDKDKLAGVSLAWKPPQRAEEIIPARQLSPRQFPEVFVVGAEFPPDDRSMGYERGNAVSRAWDEATTYGAIEAAGYVESHLRELVGVGDGGNERTQKMRGFAAQFVERAFRRLLGDDERRLFVDQHFDTAPDADLALKRVILLALKSPRFLYPDAATWEGEAPAEPKPDSHTVAARLALAMWDSLPDEPLRQAAAHNELSTREQVAAQAQRMLAESRTRAKMREFFHQWLLVDRMQEMAKDAEQYPEFDPQLVSDLRMSLDLWLDEVMWSDTSDFRTLLAADTVYMNGRMAKFYGVDLPANADFRQIARDEQTGVLTHPLLMSGFAYHSASSPIHRGVFISRKLLGRTLRPPPVAIAPLNVDLHPSLTTRERTIEQTKESLCQSCHSMINPLGFSLENFDAVGRFRQQEKEKDIDASGSYNTLAGETVRFTGARELAAFLAASPEAHKAFVGQMFHYTVKQPIRAHGVDAEERITQSFVDNQFNMQKLLLEIATTAALR